MSVESSSENFKTIVRDCAEAVLGRRRGTRRDQWISDDSWRLNAERRDMKIKRNQEAGNQPG